MKWLILALLALFGVALVAGSIAGIRDAEDEVARIRARGGL